VSKRFLRIPRRVVRMAQQGKITVEDLGLLVCYLEHADYETGEFTAKVTSLASDLVQERGEDIHTAAKGLRRANERLRAAGVLDWEAGKRGQPVDFRIVGDDFGIDNRRPDGGPSPRPVDPPVGRRDAPSEAGASQDVAAPMSARPCTRDETRRDETRPKETKEAILDSKSQDLAGEGELEPGGVEEDRDG
jgi:hypothetical protein